MSTSGSSRSKSDELRDALQRLVDERERTSELLVRLSELVHKINNPLTSLLGRVQILKLRVDSDPELRKAADVVEESAKRIADCARDMGGVVRQGRDELQRGTDPVEPR